MLSIIEAKNIAIRELEKSRDSNLELLISGSEEYELHFVFYYNSKKYIETKNPGFLLGGNAPIIVDKLTGKIGISGTARSTEYYINLNLFEDYNDRISWHIDLQSKDVRKLTKSDWLKIFRISYNCNSAEALNYYRKLPNFFIKNQEVLTSLLDSLHQFDIKSKIVLICNEDDLN